MGVSRSEKRARKTRAKIERCLRAGTHRMSEVKEQEYRRPMNEDALVMFAWSRCATCRCTFQVTACVHGIEERSVANPDQLLRDRRNEAVWMVETERARHASWHEPEPGHFRWGTP